MLAQSINYKEKLEETMQDLNLMYDDLTKQDNSLLRQYYNKAYNVISDKDDELVRALDEINEIIDNLEQCKEMIPKLRERIHNNKVMLNNAKVGTLEGLTRQQITQLGIRPKIEQEAEVLDQPYVEPKPIVKKGGKKTRKTRKMRRK